jgi:multidrug efflux pump subunit AcrA (membrane-fusion protein)
VNRYLVGTVLLINTLFALDIPIDEVERRTFSESISTNSQVVQLSSSKSTLMARLGGKVINYKVKEGDSIKKGQLVAIIESLELTSQLAKIKGLRKQLSISNKNYKMVKKLYNIGVESLQNLNSQEEERTQLLSQIEVIKSRLSSVKGRNGNQYKVYAQSSGRIDKVLTPLNSVVDSNEPLISLLKGKESFLIKSFIPLKYATKIRVGQKGSIRYGEEEYKMHITQILPTIDQQTQKMTVLSTLEKPVNNLFVNTFLDSKLFLGAGKSYLTVKKSALSFFNNEWVVFVPEHHEDEHHDKHEKHNDHENHAHDEHNDHETRRGRASVPTHAQNEKEHKKHNDHENHAHDEHNDHEIRRGRASVPTHANNEEDHEEEEVPYDIRVIKILKEHNGYVAIEGLKEHEDYVSDKSYYIKSLLLKSSLGGHGH